MYRIAPQLESRLFSSSWSMSVVNIFCFGCLLFIVACSGQVKVPPKENVIVYAEDPLFYIDGQLCQHLREIYEDKRGHLWFGTNVYGLMRYDGNTLQYFDESDGLGAGRITKILEDEYGNLWIGTYGGLTKYDPVVSEQTGKESFTNYTSDNPSVSHNIWSMLIDEEGIFWLGTLDGVSQFDGKEFSAFPIPKADIKNPTLMKIRAQVFHILQKSMG